MTGFRVALTIGIVLHAVSASAQIYAGRGADDTVVLSNFRGAQTPTLLISPDAPGSKSAAAVGSAVVNAASSEWIRSIVVDVADEVQIPAHLLHAVIAVESAYDAKAVSPKGAQGLMQLMPATARRFGVLDSFDPRQNVLGGALYLKWLLDLFGGDLQLAVAAYNAGEQAVIKAGYRIPNLAETQRYVPRVLARLPAVRG
jgi:soluble lytic murein transglycosylase-like protein